MTAGAGTLWFDILKAKYFPFCSPMFAAASQGSQFWKDLIKVRDVFRDQVKFVVGNGASTRFWLDWWSGDSPLASSFPVLFSYCSNPDISISELSANEWDLGLRRSLSPVELDDWHRLAALFPTLSEEDDSVVWPHVASGKFSVKSLYSRLISGTPTSKFKNVWAAKVPPKIKIFLWQAFRGRLPSADQFRIRNGPGTVSCALCSQLEDTNHIFFGCVLAKLAWCCVRSWLEVSWAPNSFDELRLVSSGLHGASKRLFWVGFGALGWALWTTRNKFTIEGVFPNKPTDFLFKMSILLQQWKLLTKQADRDALEAMIIKVRTSALLLSSPADADGGLV